MKIRVFEIFVLVLLVAVFFCACNDNNSSKDTTVTSDTEETVETYDETTSIVDFYDNEDEYVLTFFDDFDGTYLDTDKWSYCPDWERGNVGGRWDESMITLDGKGNLVVNSSYLTNEDGSITPISGAIRTMGKFEQCKGYFEIRCKLQSARGFWFAFWLMCEGEKNTLDGIKNGAEIDICECFDVDKGLVNHALHWDGYGPDLKSIGRPIKHKECYDGQYHTFSLLWDDNGYVFYVDGKMSTIILKGHQDFPGICEVPTYLKITSEFGTWSSYYDTSELPDQVLVDYVKVYAKK